ncbi:MAG: hypothetical protein WC829_14290 [Hyphomicrobium sp.]|jgi:hypothetical protein
MTVVKNSATGEIVRFWEEFGHKFEVERLLEPRLQGAGLRYFRLWDNGYPASGGQWHYTMESALKRAEYVLQGGYANRIRWLEMRVNELTGQLVLAQNGKIPQK